MCHSRPLFFNSVFSTNSYRKYWYNRSCQWLDSNQGPLVLEATALPTEPQPLPRQWIVCPWLDSNGGPLLSEASSDRDTNWAQLDKSFTTQHHPRHRRCSQCDQIWQNFNTFAKVKKSWAILNRPSTSSASSSRPVVKGWTFATETTTTSSEAEKSEIEKVTYERFKFRAVWPGSLGKKSLMFKS